MWLWNIVWNQPSSFFTVQMNTNHLKDLILSCRINQLYTHPLLCCFLPALRLLLSLCPSFLLYMESRAQVASIYKAAVCPFLLSSIFPWCQSQLTLHHDFAVFCPGSFPSLISRIKSSQEYIRIPAPPSLSLLGSYSPLSWSTPSDSVTAFAVNLLKMVREPNTCTDAPAEPQQC